MRAAMSGCESPIRARSPESVRFGARGGMPRMLPFCGGNLNQVSVSLLATGRVHPGTLWLLAA